MAKILENTVSKIKVPEGKRDILVFDDSLPGFGIRKFASGKASFFVKYQLPGGQQRKLSLGPVVPGSGRRCAAKRPTSSPRLA